MAPAQLAHSETRLNGPPAPRGEPAVRPRALILLAGSVRENELTRATGRAPITLPVRTGGGTLLDEWAAHATELAAELGLEPAWPVRVVADRPLTLQTGSTGAIALSVETDRRPFRGT